MKYLKLFLPIPISIALLLVIENYFFDHFLTGGIIIKTACFIYYLRLDRSQTPFLNALTGLLLLMGVSEYILAIDFTLGKIMLIVSTVAFGFSYFFRQRLKTSKDSLSKLKIAAVLTFVFAEVYCISSSDTMIPVFISLILMGAVYLYDRLTT